MFIALALFSSGQSVRRPLNKMETSSGRMSARA